LVCGIVLSSCATRQGTFVPLGPSRSPKAADAPVEVFRSGHPARGFTRVAQVEAHMEKTHLIPSSFAEAEAVLQEQAGRAGADAVIEIREQRSHVGETLIYHASGTAVCYR
jgi:hypothetical protein